MSSRALYINNIPLHLLVLLCSLLMLSAHSDNRKPVTEATEPIPALAFRELKAPGVREMAWVDSVYNSMTLDERIGQLFMIRAHSNLGPEHVKKVEDQIKKFHVGGLCFFQGTPYKQLELTQKYQALSQKVPLMISMDAEWGLGMRLNKDSVIVYPRSLMMGAIDDNQIVYNFGREIGKQLKRLGVHINFGPVVDINNNPLNPVINDRSFGEDKYNVVTKSYMYMIGLQDEGVMACAKHFPGHGDTQVDSHYDLPVVNYDIRRLEQFELFPFQLLADNGLQSMMIAHMHIPALDSTPNLPTTLSPAVVDTLLRQRMQFNGLVFTDALEMKGVTKNFKQAEIATRAILAGNDVLLLPEDIEVAFKALKDGFLDLSIPLYRLEESVKRILKAKFRTGLTYNNTPTLENLANDLNNGMGLLIKEEIIANAMTLVKDTAGLIPVQYSSGQKTLVLSIGSPVAQGFPSAVQRYIPADTMSLSMNFTVSQRNELLQDLDKYDLLLISVHPGSRLATKEFGITQQSIQLIRQISKSKKTIISVFGNPYSLQLFGGLSSVVMAYEDDLMVHDLCVQALFGARSFTGKLPVSVGNQWKFRSGIESKTTTRLKYGIAEGMGVSTRELEKLDGIAKEMMQIKAAPGCQIMVIKDQTVIYHKAFGKHIYDGSRPVKLDDLYDVASVTKVASTTLALMKLYEDGKIDLDKTLGDYLPVLKGSNKENLVIKDVMAHRAGLYPWLPFYRKTITAGKGQVTLDSTIYKTSPQPGYIQVAENIYLDTVYMQNIWTQIRDSELLPTKAYRYSDLGFILFSKLVFNVTGLTLDEYVDKEFYKPLGMYHTMFNPRTKIDPVHIIPTEDDNYFRSQLLRGYVHDMAAAMLGGVSGHAGLFSNANDMGILMTMLSQKGTYAGKSYLKPETIEYFTTRYPGETRRALGFDMQQLDRTKGVNVTGLASAGTFGHTGFTGTCAWVDPECGVTFIFLSNRVYPTMDNNKLNDYQYRLRMHYAVYKAAE